MKTTIILKEFSALSSDAVQGTHAAAPAIPESPTQPTPESVQGFHVSPDSNDESFRDLLHRRHSIPFPCTSPQHRWGLNE